MSVLKNVLIGIDQTVNCAIRLSDGFGKPDETLSARAWRLRADHPRLCVWIDRVMFFDPSHCRESYESEVLRKQLPLEYQKCP